MCKMLIFRVQFSVSWLRPLKAAHSGRQVHCGVRRGKCHAMGAKSPLPSRELPAGMQREDGQVDAKFVCNTSFLRFWLVVCLNK